MAWVSPTTRAAGYTAGSAVWNQDVVDNPTFLYQKPFAEVYHNTTQSVSSGSTTTLSFNSENFDTDTMHDNVTNNSRLTVNTAGVYLITAYAFVASGGVGTYFSVLRVNGATGIASNSFYHRVAATAVYITVSGLWKFAASDYVELRFFQNSGSSVTVEANPTFSMQWIGSGS